MKTILLVVFALVPTMAFAKITAYELTMEVSMKGKPFNSRLTVKEGQKGMISQKIENEEPFVEVVATEAQKNGIMMKFQVGYLQDGGVKRILAEPAIVALEGEPAKIEIGQSGKDKVSVSVTAKRMSM